MPVDDPPFFVPLEGETPYASYLNKLQDAVQSAVLHEPNPTKEQAQAATDAFFATRTCQGRRSRMDKENFALNRDTALRAFGAVTTRRALGPNLRLQLEKGKEKRGGKRRIGGAEGASEEESDTPATTRRKGSPSRSPTRGSRSTAQSPARRSAVRSLSRRLTPGANDFGGFDGPFDGGFDGDFNRGFDGFAANDFQHEQQHEHRPKHEHEQQPQEKEQQEPAAAGNLSPRAVYAKLEELASQVARCATKEDLQQVASKEEVASLHTKVDDLNTKVEALKVADVEKKVASVEQKVEVLETTVKDLHKKAEDIGTEVKCLPEISTALERIQAWVDKPRAEDNRKLMYGADDDEQEEE
ncbi:hypothetical protein JCM10296v2_003007 [Rhodotorula toruloides]